MAYVDLKQAVVGKYVYILWIFLICLDCFGLACFNFLLFLLFIVLFWRWQWSSFSTPSPRRRPEKLKCWRILTILLCFNWLSNNFDHTRKKPGDKKEANEEADRQKKERGLGEEGGSKCLVVEFIGLWGYDEKRVDSSSVVPSDARKLFATLVFPTHFPPLLSLSPFSPLPHRNYHLSRKILTLLSRPQSMMLFATPTVKRTVSKEHWRYPTVFILWMLFHSFSSLSFLFHLLFHLISWR